MLLNKKINGLLSKSSKHIPVGIIISVLIFFELLVVIGGWKYKPDII